jgi:hypothetical protein
MSCDQRLFDKLIVTKNKNESYSSPLRYNPIFHSDLYSKGKLYGNRNSSYNKQSSIARGEYSQDNNYYDIQNKYLIKTDNKPKQSSDNYFNHIIYKNSDNAEFSKNKNTLASPYVNSNNNNINNQDQSKWFNSSLQNDEVIKTNMTKGLSYNFSTQIDEGKNLNSKNVYQPSPLKNLESEYTEFYRKYPTPDRGNQEYIHNKVVGYGRSIILSPYKDYSVYFAKQNN